MGVYCISNENEMLSRPAILMIEMEDIEVRFLFYNIISPLCLPAGPRSSLSSSIGPGYRLHLAVNPRYGLHSRTCFAYRNRFFD